MLLFFGALAIIAPTNTEISKMVLHCSGLKNEAGALISTSAMMKKKIAKTPVTTASVNLKLYRFIG